jgi:hypothetical protein
MMTLKMHQSEKADALKNNMHVVGLVEKASFFLIL